MTDVASIIADLHALVAAIAPAPVFAISHLFPDTAATHWTGDGKEYWNGGNYRI